MTFFMLTYHFIATHTVIVDNSHKKRHRLQEAQNKLKSWYFSEYKGSSEWLMLEKKHHLNVFERYVKAERLIVVRVEGTSKHGSMLVTIKEQHEEIAYFVIHTISK